MASQTALQRIPTKTKIGPYNWTIEQDTQMAYDFLGKNSPSAQGTIF